MTVQFLSKSSTSLSKSEQKISTTICIHKILQDVHRSAKPNSEKSPKGKKCLKKHFFPVLLPSRCSPSHRPNQCDAFCQETRPYIKHAWLGHAHTCNRCVVKLQQPRNALKGRRDQSATRRVYMPIP